MNTNFTSLGTIFYIFPGIGPSGPLLLEYGKVDHSQHHLYFECLKKQRYFIKNSNRLFRPLSDQKMGYLTK